MSEALLNERQRQYSFTERLITLYSKAPKGAATRVTDRNQTGLKGRQNSGGGLLAAVILLAVITLVIIIIVRLHFRIIQNHAEYLRANFLQ